jgi:hypothetical protein
MIIICNRDGSERDPQPILGEVFFGRYALLLPPLGNDE